MTLGLATAGPAAAEIYRWTDGAGDVHFSDSIHSVPERYRRQIQTRSSELPPAPPSVKKEQRAGPPAPEVPLEKRNDGYIVRALFNGRETARLIVDTGATATVISPAFAARLGLAVRWDPPVTMKTVGGDTQGGWADVESIDVGGHQVSPLRVVVYEFTDAADGLLGMNFLHAFRVEIRAQRPSMMLYPP